MVPHPLIGHKRSFVAQRPKYFFIGRQEDIFAIISFSFVSIRHHLGILLFLGIFQNLWAAKDLFVAVRPIFFIGRWEGYFYYNFIQFYQHQMLFRCPFNFRHFWDLWAAKDLLLPWGSILCIKGWKRILNNYVPKKIEIQEY